MSYDDKGNVLTASNSSTSSEYSYVSILGKDYVKTISIAGNDVPQYGLSYNYNAAGSKKSMTSNFISINYALDDAYRTIGVENSLGQSFGMAYDQANRLRELSRSNGITSSYSFDNNSFLTSLLHKKGGNALENFAYTRDAIGNRTSMTTTRGTFAYSYDSENQVISASHPEADSLFALETFTYDSLGNRTTDNQGAYGYDDKKFRLEEDYKYLYAYDLNGNLISKQEKGLTGKVWTYIYSSENQLKLAELYDGTTKIKSVAFGYDFQGRRVKKSVQDVQNGTAYERRYAYDGNEIIAELDENNSVLARYTHSGLRTDDVLSVEISSAGVSRGLASSTGDFSYLKDGLGSVNAIADSGGNVVQRYVYSSFGQLLKVTDASGVEMSPIVKTSYTYTNRELDDETGLYYYRARYYDAHSGRFMQEDPHSGDIRNPITVTNRYVYGGNNPVMNVDPNGRFFFAAIIIGAVLGGVIADANGGNFLEGALIGAAAGGVGAFVGGAVGLGVGNAVSGAIGGTAGSFFGGVAAFGAGAFVGGSVGGLAGGVVGAGIGAVNGRGAEEGLFYGLGLGFSVGAITGGLAGLGSYAYGDFLFNDVDFGIDAFGIKTNSIQRYIYNEAYGTASGLSKILKGPNGTEYLPVF